MSLKLKYSRNQIFSFAKSKIASKIELPKGVVQYTNKLGVNFELHMDQYLMKNIYLYDIPEANTFNQIKRICKVKDVKTIIDCGGNIGLYSLNLAKIYPNASIHAFEPLDFNFQIFRKNIKLNNFENISLNKKGVGEEKGAFEIKFGNKKSGASIYVDEFNSDGKEEIQVLKLDDYCIENNIESIDILKIDVEGGELKVLKGAQNILSNSKKCLVIVEVIEKHLKAAGDDGKSLFEFMQSLGFKIGLPKSWPFKLKRISDYAEFPSNYTDNVFFIKGY